MVAEIVGTVTAVADTINKVVDTTKRRNYEIALSNLDQSQKAELDKILAKQQSQGTREQILAMALGNIQAAKVNQETVLATQQNAVTITLIIAGTVIVLGVLGFIIFKKKKG